MKLKLSYNELIALHDVFGRCVVIDAKSFNAHKKLQVAILLKLWKKLYTKAFAKKKEYSVTMDADEAIAFYLYFHNTNLVPGEMIYERNLITQINNSIHQKFIV